MEKEAKTPTIDQAIQHYWGLRAEGYSLSNVEELATLAAWLSSWTKITGYRLRTGIFSY